MKLKAGSSLPRRDKHAVSVYLPTWKDAQDWAQLNTEPLPQLRAGYPRSYVPRVVHKLSERLLKWIASTIPEDETTSELRSLLAEPERSAMLFAERYLADMCKEYLQRHTDRPAFVVQIDLDGEISPPGAAPLGPPESTAGDLYAVVHSQELVVEAKAFWKHTGHGISTRRAAYWLQQALFLNGGIEASYILLNGSIYAKETLREVIGDLLSTETNKLDKDAVFLYPTGMSAISHTADAVRRLHGSGGEALKVAVFGFLYVDTFKVLSKIHGFDCKLYGHAILSELEADLAAGMKLDALYTEFPGNPLLGSVDLDRLYKLANDYNFIFIVDDTVATPVNVDIISSCDLVCTSLTTMFSGACDVMGGSIALNPQSRLFARMQEVLKEISLDTWFALDALAMADNNRQFKERVEVASENAEHIADTLRQHSSVDQVYYPKGSPTQDIYERFKRPGKGYGYLLSILFKTPEAAIAFHDAFDMAKGPSLGTNFTLCSAYTLFAHSSELEWAAEFGVVEHLVRISVGFEMQEQLDEVVGKALAAAAKSMESVTDGEP
ncbi:hypothetical protein CEP51_014109 [Fusarium floridanum]|uniref:Cystathionine gamma-synthase n=1 Tax=Fusarium floridanum TaxID=1325733 RepID=A0A428PYX7_9HYPO|nr:hypothetical protein CEP51_014109 [Fusarium floridanum]